MHTAEPWDVYEGNANGKGLIRIEAGHESRDAGQHVVAFPRGNRPSANADRVVACVNAMAGIADPAAFVVKVREAIECEDYEILDRILKEVNAMFAEPAKNGCD